MSRHEMPGESDAKPARARRARPLNALQKLLGALFLLALLGGGVWLYVQIGQHTELAGTLPLPKSLRTVSEAHGELLLYGRSLDEVSVEALGLLRVASPKNAGAVSRLRQRIARLHGTGRNLEPRLTREESRALIALQQGERALDESIEVASTVGAGFSTVDLKAAQSQVRRGLALARGATFDELVVSGLKRSTPGALQGTAAALQDVQEAGGKLQQFGE